jgi:hypothetical protein
MPPHKRGDPFSHGEGVTRVNGLPPTCRALQREVHVIHAVELRKPLPYRLPRGGSDPPARHLAAYDVDDRVRDLATMNIKRAYDPVGCVNSVTSDLQANRASGKLVNP